MSISKNHILVNHDELGNIISADEVEILTKTTKRHFKKGEFVTMKKEFLYDVICKYDLKLLDLKILGFLIKTIDFNNRIKTFNQKKIAKEIGSSQPRVSESIKKLIEKNIIFKYELDYYFSDEFIKFAGDKKNK